MSTAPASAGLQVRQLALRFGGVHAIRDVSFDVAPGEIFAIIGPNGAGKTSVFNVITRVFDPTAGSVLFGGVDLIGLPRHRVVEQGIARTFQNIELFEGATVLDNLMLGCHRFARESFWGQCLWTPKVRQTEAQLRAHVEDVIDLLDLAPHRNTLITGLPYGVRKVVELARALATRPQVLLLDEPASGLDEQETDAFGDLLLQLAANGLGILLVEHDVPLVMRVCERLSVLDFGQIIAEGTPAEVRSNEAVLSAYLGTGPTPGSGAPAVAPGEAP